MSTNKKFTFVGDSFTYGIGLIKEKNDNDNWVNIVSTQYSTIPLNLAVAGNSIHEIFRLALNEILYNTPNVLFVQWGASTRIEFYPDTYVEEPLRIQVNTAPEYLLHRQEQLNSVRVFSNKHEAKQFIDNVILLNHEYYQLTELIDYVNILQTVAKDKCDLVFTNGGTQWTKEIQHLDNIKDWESELAPFMKDVLDFNSNTDIRLAQLGTALSKKFNKMDKSQWVNLFNSIHNMAIDRGLDNLHPGPQTNANYAQLVIDHLKLRNLSNG